MENLEIILIVMICSQIILSMFLSFKDGFVVASNYRVYDREIANLKQIIENLKFDSALVKNKHEALKNKK